MINSILSANVLATTILIIYFVRKGNPLELVMAAFLYAVAMIENIIKTKNKEKSLEIGLELDLEGLKTDFTDLKKTTEELKSKVNALVLKSGFIK